jgi:hypothetical protein
MFKIELLWGEPQSERYMESHGIQTNPRKLRETEFIA